jgi:hypothetical protein
MSALDAPPPETLPPLIPDPCPLIPGVEGEGFEPSKAEPADLQSAPFDRSGTPPSKRAILAVSAPNGQTGSGAASQGRGGPYFL